MSCPANILGYFFAIRRAAPALPVFATAATQQHVHETVEQYIVLRYNYSCDGTLFQ